MSENITVPVSDNELIKIVSEIGCLVVDKGLSYNQTQKIFELVLERLKDVPYHLSKSNTEKP